MFNKGHRFVKPLGFVLAVVLVGTAYQNCSSQYDTKDPRSDSTSRKAASDAEDLANEKEIQALYEIYLGRAATADEVASWLDRLAQGTSLSEIGQQLAGSPEARIRQLYLTHYQREPKIEELASWLALLQNGRSFEDVQTGILSSAGCLVGCLTSTPTSPGGPATPVKPPDETAAVTAQIQTFYRTHLGRESDPQGLAHFLARAQQGVTLEEISHEILNSPEANIRRMYLTSLGREPDPEGMRYWLTSLQNGQTLDQVSANIRRSPECQKDCIDVVAEKVQAIYRTELGREADPAGLSPFTKAAKSTSVAIVQEEIRGALEARLRRLYLTYLRREPDSGGLAEWHRAVAEGGKPFDFVEASFRNAADCKASCIQAPLLALKALREGKIRAIYRLEMGREPDAKELSQALTQAQSIGLEKFRKDLRGTVPAQIRSLYLRHLLREPDAPGLAGWAKAVQSEGRSVAWVAKGLAGAAECKVNCNVATPSDAAILQDRVARLYRIELGREPDSAGLNHYVSFAKTKGLGQVQWDLRNSPEGRVRQLYREYLLREPDAPGLNTWLTAISAGKKTVEWVEANFKATPECQMNCTTQNEIEEQVKAIYRTELGREADPGGLNHFVNRAKMIGVARTQDEVRSTAEAKVRRLYLTYLLREPDGEGLANAVNALKAGASVAQLEANLRAAPECKVSCFQ